MRRQSLQFRRDWIALGSSTTNQHRLQQTETMLLRALANLGEKDWGKPRGFQLNMHLGKMFC